MPTHTLGVKLGRIDIMKAALYEVGLPELAEEVISCRESSIFPYYCTKPNCVHDVPILNTELWAEDSELTITVVKCFWLGHISMGCDCSIDNDGCGIYCSNCFGPGREDDEW